MVDNTALELDHSGLNRGVCFFIYKMNEIKPALSFSEWEDHEVIKSSNNSSELAISTTGELYEPMHYPQSYMGSNAPPILSMRKLRHKSEVTHHTLMWDLGTEAIQPN